MLVDEHKPQWQVTKDGNPTMASRSYSQWQVERRSHGFHSWAYSLRNSSSTKRERLAIDLASHRWTWRWAWRQFLREQVSSSGRNFQPQHSRVGERERESWLSQIRAAGHWNLINLEGESSYRCVQLRAFALNMGWTGGSSPRCLGRLVQNKSGEKITRKVGVEATVAPAPVIADLPGREKSHRPRRRIEHKLRKLQIWQI